MSKISKANLDNLNSKPSIVWFRQDLRLEDNPAVTAALARNAPLIPLYIWAPQEEEPWSPGAASQVWLHQSLVAFNQELEKLGSRLIIRCGDTFTELKAVINETKATAVFWNCRYEPTIIDRDEIIKRELKKQLGVIVGSFNGSLLYEPEQILKKDNKPYLVYGAFWRACSNYGEVGMPLKTPSLLLSPKVWPQSLSVEKLGLMPTINWADCIIEFWPAGSTVAKLRLKEFIDQKMGKYNTGRDRPDLNFVSYLSPYLHLGQLSPRQIVHSVQSATERSSNKDFVASAQIYLKEIVWREFAYYLLFHFPHISDKPLRAQYSKFPWRLNKKYLYAWQNGKTGYPIVDAGMRQLWQTGWMHNRVRMIVASFLVKDLLIPWQYGAKWFWHTLVDADLANNTLGWQWSAGCGADAMPYFRVFNPISQGQKFDPEGVYIKRFVPELANLSQEYIHTPWLANKQILQRAKITLGQEYPQPIVDHSQARLKALAAWRQLKNGEISK